MKFSKNSRILQKLKPKNSISGISKIFRYPECGQKKAGLTTTPATIKKPAVLKVSTNFINYFLIDFAFQRRRPDSSIMSSSTSECGGECCGGHAPFPMPTPPDPNLPTVIPATMCKATQISPTSVIQMYSAAATLSRKQQVNPYLYVWSKISQPTYLTDKLASQILLFIIN